MLAVAGVVVVARAADDAPTPPEKVKPVKAVSPFEDPELKKKHPFQSLVERLDYEKKRDSAEAVTLTDETKARLKRAEHDAAREYFTNDRRRALQMMHGSEVKGFIDREGFGMLRLRSPTIRSLDLPATGSIAFAPAPEKEPNVGPAVVLPKTMPASAEAGSALLPGLDRLESFHSQGVYSFVNFSRLGLVKDREHVAGFAGHQFAFMPPLNVRLPESTSGLKEKMAGPAPGAGQPAQA